LDNQDETTAITLFTGRRVLTACGYAELVELLGSAQVVEVVDLAGRTVRITPAAVAMIEESAAPALTVQDRARAELALRAAALGALFERDELSLAPEYQSKVDALVISMLDALSEGLDTRASAG